MSTWGTWGLMGMNVLLFLVFQIGVEPWRRRRLVKGFEEKVVEALEKETAAQKSIATIAAAAAAAAAAEVIPIPTILLEDDPNNTQVAPILQDLAESIAIAIPEEIPKVEAIPILPDDHTWQDSLTHTLRTYASRLLQMFSNQQVELRQVDITAKFLEGAFSSAVAISLLAAMFRGR